MQILLLLIFVIVPVALYFWREHRYNTPSIRWPEMAEDLSFEYSPSPPTIRGEWKGREVTATALESSCELRMPLACAQSVRVQIGPKAEMEAEAGMVVHDKVLFGDPAFEERCLVRADPRELGELAVDAGMRRRLLELPGVRVRAQNDGVLVTAPPARETDLLRSYMDICVTLGDALENF